MSEQIETIDRLTGGFYSVGEVRLLSGVKETVSRRFVKSYKETYGLWGGGQQKLAGNAYLTFRDMLEIRHVSAFHTAGVSWQRIIRAASRRAARRAKSRFDTEHPFSDLRFKTDGAHIFNATGTDLEQLSGYGQLAFKHVFGDHLFDPVDYEDYEAVCWYPAEEWGMTHEGREVIVNPKLAFGTPVIAGYHIPTEVLYWNYKAELNDLESVALTYEIPLTSVEFAVAFQEELLARN